MDQSAGSSLALDPRPTWKLVLSLAWPALVQQLLAFTVHVSDALLAGRFPPPQGRHVASQAAQTTAIYLAWLITNYTYLVSIGSTALVARFLGAGEPQRAIHVTNQSILLAAIVGLAGSVGGLVGLRGLVEVLQVRGEAAVFAVEYLRPMLALLVFQVIESAGIACLVGAGDTRSGMLILTIVAVVNVPLAWGFHRGVGPMPGLGFPGIALGTAVSHVIGATLVLILLARGRAGLKLRLSMLWLNGKLCRRILRVSVPAGLDRRS